LPGVDALGQAARLRPPRLCLGSAIELGSDPTLAGVTLGHRSYATLGRVWVLLGAPSHRLVLASLGHGEDALERAGLDLPEDSRPVLLVGDQPGLETLQAKSHGRRSAAQSQGVAH